MLVALDSSVLVHVVRGWRQPATATAAEIKIADYVRWRREVRRDTFSVPAVAFGELLCGDGTVTEEDAATLAEEMSKIYEILPFDVKAAWECRRIFVKVARKKHFHNIGGSSLKSWQSYKLDMLVLATSVAYRVDEVLANDTQIASIGSEVGVRVLGFDQCVIPDEEPPPGWPSRGGPILPGFETE